MNMQAIVANMYTELGKYYLLMCAHEKHLHAHVTYDVDLSVCLCIYCHTNSFHIGDCVDPLVFEKALKMSCEVFDYARDQLDLTLSMVDIGGGFTVGEQKESEATFIQAATVINESVEKVFTAYPNVKLIAEPGRFFAKSTTCSFAQIIGKRRVTVEDRQVRIHFQFYNQIPVSMYT